MTTVRLVHKNATRSYAVAMVPKDQLPKLLRRDGRLYVYRNTQLDRPVFEEVDPLDVFTDGEIEQAKQNGDLT